MISRATKPEGEDSMDGDCGFAMMSSAANYIVGNGQRYLRRRKGVAMGYASVSKKG